MVRALVPRVVVLASTYLRPHPGRLVPDLVARLRHNGLDAWVEDPDDHPHQLTERGMPADLYVLKSGTETALSLAGALTARGARVLNPYAVAAVCRDKVVQTQVLTSAGVPMPRSWLTADAAQLGGRLADGPLIVKNPRGSRGRGLHVVHDPASLGALGPGPWLAMRYHQPDGHDLKLYRIGEELFCVERPFPARTYEEKCGRLLPVPAPLEDLVRRCGAAFGIDVYGVDVIRHQGRHLVVDMSAFPGFKGVPEAGRRIADHVTARLRRGRQDLDLLTAATP